ncbi:MAG: CinA family nicotinamide mononucleotide deamidase-related protein [Thermoleophilia bacterium]
MVRAAVVVTGDEVLHGRVAEANAAHLCAWLESRGVVPHGIEVVPDELPRIGAAVAGRIAEGIELVLVTGGLGGTHDDLTMEAVAAAVGAGYRLDPEALVMVEASVAALRVPGWAVDPAVRAEANRKQATLPEGARVLPPVGTAPGCVLRAGASLVVVLPGPPVELQPMWERAATEDPDVRALLAGRAEGRRVLRLGGVVETQMIEALRDLDPAVVAGARVGICARYGELEVTVADAGAPGAAAALTHALRDRFGASLYSEDGSTLVQVLGGRLVAAGHTLAVAESCTAGMVGARLTELAGASAWFLGGVLSYANAVKRDQLGVPQELLDAHGAVSAECATAMAQGVRERLGADWGLSITGIAGPDGGTAEKPVGTVYVGVAGPGVDEVRHHLLRGSRDRIRSQATAVALHLLRVHVPEVPSGDAPV